jgi:hypothetical protein
LVRVRAVDCLSGDHRRPVLADAHRLPIDLFQYHLPLSCSYKLSTIQID